MRRVAAVLIVGVLASSASAFTPTFDGILDEWYAAPDVLNLGTEPGINHGPYTLLTGWDASNLYVGVDRNASDRYLGDTAPDNDSFFFAIDFQAGGASLDGYSRMNFGGSDLPDVIYYFTGGAGWYEWSIWDPGPPEWSWQGWSSTGTYYGWQEDNPDDELTIPLANIGGSENVKVWAWMTEEGNTFVEASWPSGHTGESPTFNVGIHIPEPTSLSLLVLGGLALLRRR